MQTLRGELMRARSVINELLADPMPRDAMRQLAIIQKVAAMTLRLQLTAMEAMALQIERAMAKRDGGPS